MQKTKKRLIAQHEFVLLPDYKETPVGVSMTVPDESMSIREILQKHVTGLNIVGQMTREASFGDDPHFDDIDMEKFRDSDIYERSEIVQQNKRKVEDLTKQVEQHTKKQKTATTKPEGENADQKGAAEHSDGATKERSSNARQSPETGGEKPSGN